MPSLPAIVRYLAISAGFCLLWINLHWLAVAFEAAPGASVWYPARGLSLALLLVFGLRYAPALFVASLIGGVAYHLPEHPEHWLGVAALITVVMTVVAWSLARLGFSAVMRLRDAVLLILLSAAGAFVTALGVVGVNVRSGLLATERYWDVSFQFFVGDYLGILILVPLAVLLAARPFQERRRLRAAGVESLAKRALEALLIAGTALTLLLLAVGTGVHTPSALGRWYLLLLPLALAAVRFGPLGAAVTTASLSVCVVVVARQTGSGVGHVDLQLLLLSFAVVSLLLSAAVADRQRSQEALANAHRAEAQRARREAEHLRQSKARFLAATTHDLRPPFEAVRLGLETLRMQGLPAEAQAVLERVDGAARSLGRVLESVLDTARLEGEIRSASPRPVAIGPLLARLAAEAAANHPGGNRAVRAAATDLYAVTDPLLFERLMRNLLANAVRASVPHGRVLVGCRRHDMMIRLEVHDTGSGITPERLSNMFEPFVSGHAGGSGIGLSLVREIADQLGVNLNVRSELRRGTVFTFELPAAATSGPGRVAAGAVRDRIIALATAQPVRRQLLATVLSNWGAAVVAAAAPDAVRYELEQLRSRADLLMVDDVAAVSANERAAAHRVAQLPSAPAARPLSADLHEILKRLR